MAKKTVAHSVKEVPARMATPVTMATRSDGIVTFVKENFSLILIFLIVFMIGFFTGSMYKENKMLKAGLVTTATTPTAGTTATDTTAEPTPDYAQIPPVSDKDHVRGAKDGKITLIEYSDYECPYCNRFRPTMTQLMENYGDQITWVYRQYPLSFHPNAQKLAEAGECVAKYGSEDAFWKFSDTVFSKMEDKSIYSNASTSTVDEETILTLAAQAGANRNNVKSCLDKGEMKQTVSDMQAAATKAGISGTPSTIILSDKGNSVIPGALPYEQVETMIKNAL